MPSAAPPRGDPAAAAAAFAKETAASFWTSPRRPPRHVALGVARRFEAARARRPRHEDDVRRAVQEYAVPASRSRRYDALLEVVARYEGRSSPFDDEGAARAAVAAELRRLPFHSNRMLEHAAYQRHALAATRLECHATNLQRELLQTAADKQKGRDGRASAPIDELGQDVYRVDYLLGKRDKDAKVQYLVRWVGYDANDDTWEDEANIIDKKLIRDFQRGVSAPRGGPSRTKTTAPRPAARRRRRRRWRRWAAPRQRRHAPLAAAAAAAVAAEAAPAGSRWLKATSLSRACGGRRAGRGSERHCCVPPCIPLAPPLTAAAAAAVVEPPLVAAAAGGAAVWAVVRSAPPTLRRGGVGCAFDVRRGGATTAAPAAVPLRAHRRGGATTGCARRRATAAANLWKPEPPGRRRSAWCLRTSSERRLEHGGAPHRRRYGPLNAWCRRPRQLRRWPLRG